MKRLSAVFAAFALFGTVFVLASGPAAAGTVEFTAINDGSSGVVRVTASAPCGKTVAKDVQPNNGQEVFALNQGCNYSVLVEDAAAQCTVTVSEASNPFDVDVPPADPGGPADPASVNASVSGVCADADGNINVAKHAHQGPNIGLAEATLFNYTIVPDESPAACGNHSVKVAGNDDEDVKVPISVLHNGEIVSCYFAVTETLRALWTLTDVAGSNGDDYPNSPTAYASGDGGDVDFWNSFAHVGITVTKTFLGRDYYTTVDRADFHVFLPGLCGNLPVAPFGNLLGSIGVYRTINASQEPQVVLWLPSTAVYLEGNCTYRVQENNAPEGCVAVAPTGSNADGPYWEQTWAPGMSELVFNIVNTCSPPPEPTPEPTVAPTTVPAKPGHKQPSSGGSAAPKFAG